MVMIAMQKMWRIAQHTFFLNDSSERKHLHIAFVTKVKDLLLLFSTPDNGMGVIFSLFSSPMTHVQGHHVDKAYLLRLSFSIFYEAHLRLYVTA